MVVDNDHEPDDRGHNNTGHPFVAGTDPGHDWGMCGQREEADPGEDPPPTAENAHSVHPGKSSEDSGG